ncbi:MAG: homogentisate 1,2-dioxygenase [Legionellales bacterium RIFCSPHIGHO2_12_FULL_37_14]|nr:MAG: homogentisate 1,2-dioxygenase [Legionellales bacterium RIFCSPHIGHO2_12_FULL_37_14]
MPLYGFRNVHQSEALKGSLPLTQNNPQKLANNLYAEQLSGSAFTRARSANLHSWLYRTKPSVVHQDYVPSKLQLIAPLDPLQFPNPLRFSKLPSKTPKQDFLQGLFHLASNKIAHVFLYNCTQSMREFFSSYDGELIFIPVAGTLNLHTEFGLISIEKGQIAVIPRGVFFNVECESSAYGYLCENQSEPFALPELGVLGANALANPRHFIYPDAKVKESPAPITLICKYQDNCFIAKSSHSPLNVVAWQGNLAPYSYCLKLFTTINTVSFDHIDPSIFTLLTSASEIAGVANLDFVLFPPRWSVAEHTFRPPYFHRNIMSELMGLIWGKYEAKQEDFVKGGVSIHNSFIPHGPDAITFKEASTCTQKPTYLNDSLAFMLESRYPWQVTTKAMQHAIRQKDYTSCWQDL